MTYVAASVLLTFGVLIVVFSKLLTKAYKAASTAATFLGPLSRAVQVPRAVIVVAGVLFILLGLFILSFGILQDVYG